MPRNPVGRTILGRVRALVIVHDHSSPPGPLGEALQRNGFQLVEHKIAQSDGDRSDPGLPDAAGFDVVVVLGSARAVYDPAVSAWVEPEKAWLRRVDAEGVPVLGVCFGGQLLAAVHGGQVRRSERSEIGFRQIDSDDEDLVASGPWFEWHSDCWTLPPGATEIARNAVSSQAFVLRRNLALQFHPEVLSSTLRGWLDDGGTAVAIAEGLDPEALLAEALAADGRSAARAHVLVEAFLRRVAGFPPS